LFAQKIILGYSSKILAQILQMIGMLIVARILGPNVTGTLAFGLAFVSMFLFLADFGLSSAHIKFISEGQDEGKCNATFIRLKITLVILYTIVVLGFYSIQKYIFGVTFESPDHDYVVLIYLVIVSIGQIYFIPISTFAAKTEQAKQDVPYFIQIFVYQVLRIIVAFLGYKAIAQSISNLAAVILVFPLYLYLFRGNPIGKFDFALAKKYFTVSIPVFIALITNTIIYSTDRVILQYLTNSAEVGLYAAGFSISQIIKLIESSAGIIFFPMFSKYIAENNFDTIKSIVKKFEIFNLSFVLPIVMYIVIFSDFIVTVALGNKFYNTSPILSVIVLSMFTALINLPYINAIAGKGLFKLSATLCVVSMFFFVINAIVFVHPNLLNLKGIGMAISLLLTNIFNGILFMYYTKKELGYIKILQGKYQLIYGILYSAIIYFIYSNIHLNFISKIISSVLFFAGYFGIAMIIRLITVDDWKKTKEIIDLKKMYSYVNTELKN